MTKDYMKSTVTWQAHTVMKVEQECINNSIFPNGKKMTAKDIEESRNQIAICKGILAEHGVVYHSNISVQLTLF